jgi:hypothetical protein
MDDHALLDAGERRIVEIVFRWGLSLASLCMAVGMVLALVSGETTFGAVDLTHLGDMSGPGALMGVGIGILAAIPATNILVLMFFWARRRQVGLTVIALAVILTLAVAVILGQG